MDDHLIPRTEAEAEVTEDLEHGYTTRVLLQMLFPYQKPESNTITRQAGPLRLTAVGAHGLPYGRYPRLIAVYLVTEAVKRQNLPEDEARRIPLGRSMNEFLASLGITSRATGGQNGNIQAIREQMRRLASTSITAEKLYKSGSDRATLKNMPLADSMDFWIPLDGAQHDENGEPYLELSRQFYREVTGSPIPLDMTILQGIKRPRAIDVYLWATSRKYALRRPLELSWEQVQSQFSPDTPDTARGRADLRRNMKAAIKEVEDLWPEAGITIRKEGIRLDTGQPSIPRRPNSVQE